MSGVDYYDLLEVKPGASLAEIKSAHRSLVKVMHPDAGGSQVMFRLVQEAYETLSDPNRRAIYDRNRGSIASKTSPSRPKRQTYQQEWAEDLPEDFRTTIHQDYPWEKPAPAPEPAAPAWVPPIPLHRIPWWDSVNPRSRVSWRPGFGWAQRWFFLVGALWSFLLAATAISIVRSDFSLKTIVIALVVIPVSYLVVTIAGWATPKFLTWLTYFWAIGMAALGAASLIQGDLSGFGIVALALGVFAIPPLGRWYLTSRVTERIFTPDFRTFNLFGAPETRLLTDEHGSDQNDPIEWRTLDLVSGYFGQIPAARIFHGLAWPGSAKVEVDHAVLCGHQLLLIDSKSWEPGHYACDERGHVLRDGEKFEEGQLRLAKTVAAYQLLMPRMKVRGIVLIHTDRPGTVSFALHPDCALTVMGVEEFVVNVGAELANEPSVIDREVFLTLLDQVRSSRAES